MARVVVGISGASGTILAHRLIQALAQEGHFVEMVMSREAAVTAAEEMGQPYAGAERFVLSFAKELHSNIRWHPINDLAAPIASGSFALDGCAIVPCSMATLAALSIGLADNLLRRAADVALKERRRLVIVPREAPLSEIHLENMLKLSRMGARILPPVPAWYMRPKTLEEMEWCIVGKILDALGIDSPIISRWKTDVSD